MTPGMNFDQIVVVVDAGSQGHVALQWAVNHAIALDLELRIVVPFEPPRAPSSDAAGSYATRTARAELRARQRARLVIRRTAGLDLVRYEKIVVSGRTARVVARHSRGASLVVIGTRTSTSRVQKPIQGFRISRLTRRLDCPVVAVPSEPAPLLSKSRSEGLPVRLNRIDDSRHGQAQMRQPMPEYA